MMNSHGLVLLLGLLTAVQAGALESETSRPPGWQAPPRENPEFVVFDMPVSEMERRLGVSLEAMLDRQATAKVHARTDTSRALVILCDWEDHPSNATTHSPAAFDTLLFSQGMVETGSLQEYFLEVSYGSYLLQGDVYGWFTEPVYDPWTYFTEFFAAADPYIDYTTYDLDADGYVDAVYVVHAGPGQEETHDTNDIWSFAIPSGLNYMTEDGVIIDSYACNPEEHADESIMSIRVFAHEGAHVLGLPDLYDYHSKLDTVTYFTPMDDNDHPLVDWCVMGYMGYNIMSYGTRQDPAHLCAWNKIQLGFVVPTVLSESRRCIPLPEVESNPVVYKIENSASGGMEYFLMENRNSNA